MVDVELHPVLAATSALDAPEVVSTQHVITHRTRDLRVFLVVGHTPVLVLEATLLSFFLLLGLAMFLYEHRQKRLCRLKHDGNLNKRHERLEYLGIDIGCIHSVPFR